MNDGGDSAPAQSPGTVQSDILRPARLGVNEWEALLLPVCLLHCSSLCLHWTGVDTFYFFILQLVADLVDRAFMNAFS